MTSEQQSRIVEFHESLPTGCRSKPATLEEVESFESEVARIPEEYRWYLLSCGGGVIGSEWVDDITELRDTHTRFSEEEWSLGEVFPIGRDGWGNPMVIDLSTGRILIEDHEFGGVHELASSFAEFVLKKQK